jgi:hypothetical protein
MIAMDRITLRTGPLTVLVAASAFALSGDAAAQRTTDEKPKKPSVSLRAAPMMAFSPARVVATAELKGGSDDYEDFYCASVEWDWGDGTRSEYRDDCDPFVKGKSEIRRRFTAEHTFRVSFDTDRTTDFRIQFRLKQKDKVVGSASTTVRVRPGAGGSVAGQITRGSRGR